MIDEVRACRFPRSSEDVILENIDIGPLSALAIRHGSDKWGAHRYTPHYEAHFSVFRDREINLLEIGIGGYEEPSAGGASLRMWRDYFLRARIVALDFHDKSPHAGERISIYQGDQSDVALLKRINAENGPFPIIIDDGSHENEHVLTTFQSLFPLLSPGGIYVIEDTQTSYWPFFGGSFESLNDPRTSIGSMKTLVDGLNHKEIPRPNYAPTYYDLNITQISFVHNMVFIYKGDNTHESNILTNSNVSDEYEFLIKEK